MRLSKEVDHPLNLLPKEGVFAEVNMVNISKTRPINISTKPGIGENSSSEEIAIYTTIFKELHEFFA